MKKIEEHLSTLQNIKDQLSVIIEENDHTATTTYKTYANKLSNIIEELKQQYIER